MQYSLYELQSNVEREIRENASIRTERMAANPTNALSVGLRIATLAVLALFMLPLSF